MKFMFIVKSAHVGPPPPQLMEAMHKLADREIKAGRMLDNGGLMPLATGAQVRIIDGRLSVLDGPFVEAKEVIRTARQGRGPGVGDGVHAAPQGPLPRLGGNVRASRVCPDGPLRRGSGSRGRRP